MTVCYMWLESGSSEVLFFLIFCHLFGQFEALLLSLSLSSLLHEGTGNEEGGGFGGEVTSTNVALWGWYYMYQVLQHIHGHHQKHNVEKQKESRVWNDHTKISTVVLLLVSVHMFMPWIRCLESDSTVWSSSGLVYITDHHVHPVSHGLGPRMHTGYGCRLGRPPDAHVAIIFAST